MAETATGTEYDQRIYTKYAYYLIAGYTEHSFVVPPPLIPRTFHRPNPDTGGTIEVRGMGYSSPRDEAEATFIAARLTALTVRHKPDNVALVPAPPKVAEAAGYAPGSNVFAFMVRHTGLGEAA